MTDRAVPPLTCALFDVDGTLIDSTELIARGLQEVVRRHRGKEVDHATAVSLIGRPLAYQMTVLAGEPIEPLVEDFVRFYEENVALERVLDDAVALVHLAHHLGLAVGLVTSKNAQEMANTLPRLGVAAVVDTIVVAGEAPRGKPAPDPLLLALARLGQPAASTLYIGDTEYDMQAGRAAGVLLGAAVWAAAHPERLRTHDPEFWFDRPAQAAAVLRQGAGRG